MARPKNTQTQEVKPESTSVLAGGNTVAVMCCHPQGIQFALKDGRRVVVKGNAAPLRGKEKGVLPNGGFGGVVTLIPSGDWDQIKAIYGNMDIFKNGLIFGTKDRVRAMDEAEEKKDLRHGREPVDPLTTATEPAEVGAEA